MVLLGIPIISLIDCWVRPAASRASLILFIMFSLKDGYDQSDDSNYKGCDGNNVCCFFHNIDTGMCMDYYRVGAGL